MTPDERVRRKLLLLQRLALLGLALTLGLLGMVLLGLLRAYLALFLGVTI